MSKRIYLTTSLPYVNADPHLGHAFEFVLTDVLARYYRLLEYDVRFSSGTDENSLKSVLSAEKSGISTRELVDEKSKKFLELIKLLDISIDDFIRTTERRHRDGVIKLWKNVKKFIYQKDYKGYYCVGCESFKTEDELENGVCPEHQIKPEFIEEKNYFFQLMDFKKELLELITRDGIDVIPLSRKHEALGFLEKGFDDFSISRSRERMRDWGIEVPDDSSQIMYVWFDALTNYITGLGYGADESDFKKWWEKADEIIHIIGKGILRFHIIYWPAMLLAAKQRTPTKILVHGYLTSEGQKMSKTLGNIVDPFNLINDWGGEVIRYFLCREFSSFEDGDFRMNRVGERYKTDLVHGLGNLTKRIITLAQKWDNTKLDGNELKSIIDSSWAKYRHAFGDFRINDALNFVWELISDTDKFLSEKKPWSYNENSKEFSRLISSLIYSLINIAFQLNPFMPETSKKILDLVSIDVKDKTDWQNKKLTIEEPINLFELKS